MASAGSGGAGVSMGSLRGSPFLRLTAYMDRGIEAGEGEAVLWHNFYGSEVSSTEEIIATFEANAALLAERKNGNVLYHEILSFSAGHQLKREELLRMIADVGQEYLRERASGQLAYGVVHLETDHAHLHLMISANRVNDSRRVRLSRKEFAEAQKATERYAITRYPELQQTVIYDKPKEKQQTRERVKATVNEQAMQEHRGIRARKIDLAAKLHAALEQARDFEELANWCRKEGIRFYERGKTIGIIVTEPGGNERKHRLETLGVLPHYQITNERLAVRGRGSKDQIDPSKLRDPARQKSKSQEPEKEAPMPLPEPLIAKAAQAAENIRKTAEQTVDRAGAAIKEETRFGKEVAKDFIFGTDRSDRRPNHERPPEAPASTAPDKSAKSVPQPSERDQRLESLRQAREQSKSKEKDIDRDR